LVTFAPAKLNLFLAITGRRGDGFHELVSVAAPLDMGDTLTATPAADWSLSCSDPTVPADGTNLVLRAATAFAAAVEARGQPVPRFAFRLEKVTPAGAGLGGGSSDAVATLRLLNAASGAPLDAAALASLAAQLGSDCPLFLLDGPVVMRGRGERIERLAEEPATRLRGQRVLVFKPGFGISTAWAYGRLAAGAPGSYLPAAEAEARLAAWCARRGASPAELLFNNMEPVAARKFLALPALLERLQSEFGLAVRMSGSGSACFALLAADTPLAAVTARIRSVWGDSAFVREARLG
jgi:4-diphosphocytidyl-2-C-methyl-D-erythritol kinase